MRYRRLTADGDYSFGRGVGDFLRDSPEAVAQLVKTRLLLSTGEFFLDTSEGTPYQEQVLGFGTGSTRDAAIRRRILGTQGVLAIVGFDGKLNGRKYAVSALLDTVFGKAAVTTTLG